MSKEQPDITSLFEKALSRHGYGFQYAVLREAEALFVKQESPWIPWVPEFPVEVQGKGTRIDLIFKHNRRQLYLVCECKRANPSLANWCFARAPWPDDSGFSNYSYMELIQYDGNQVRFGLNTLLSTENIFQIAIEVRTNKKGDAQGGSTDEIEAAATQVCRSYNGLINFFSGERVHSLINVNEPVGFMSVIFTTANIFASEAEVISPDITSGEIEKLNPGLTRRDWIWYDYPQSPGIKHSVRDSNPSSYLREIFYREYIRRIAIVNPSGIGSFLGSQLWRYRGSAA